METDTVFKTFFFKPEMMDIVQNTSVIQSEQHTFCSCF